MDPVRNLTTTPLSQTQVASQSFPLTDGADTDVEQPRSPSATWPDAGSVRLFASTHGSDEAALASRATVAVENARRGVPPTRQELLDGAEAAAASYDFSTPAGMRRVEPGSLGVAEQVGWSGFQSALYERQSDGTVFVSIAGTQDAVDWINNGLQGVGIIPPQYLQAAELVAAAREKYGDRVVVVGHSLGGGLASFAGLLNGARTMTFNAAGLGLGARALAWADGSLDANRGLITNVNLKGELLTSEPLLKVPALTQDRIGRVLEIEAPDPTPGRAQPFDRLEKRGLHDHKIEQVIRALRGPAELTETRSAAAPPSSGLIERIGGSLFGAVTDEIAQVAEAAVKRGAGLGTRLLETGAKTVGMLGNLLSVDTLIEGDRKVKQLGAQGQRREAMRETFGTVGEFTGAVVNTAFSAARRVPLLGRIVADVGLTEGGRALGRAFGDGVNDLFGVEDVQRKGTQPFAVSSDK